MIGVTLLDNEFRGSGMTHQIEIKAEDLTEAAVNTPQDFVVTDLEEGDNLQKAAHHLKEAFADSSDVAFNSTTMSVGDSGDDDAALVDKQLNVNGTEVLASITPNSLATVPKAYVANNQVLVRINSMAAKALADLDVGRVIVQVQVGRPSQYARS